MPPKKDYSEEATFLRNWLVTVLEFVAPSSTPYMQEAYARQITILKTNLPTTSRQMSGWRQAMNDTLEWTKAFTPEQRTALNLLLKKNTGKTLDDF